MYLRQVALVAQDLGPIRSALLELLGLDADYDDPGVGEFGLHNTVLPVGNTFLEVVSPKEAGTAAGRLLDRRGGDGGYMVIMQVDDISVISQKVAELSYRKVWETDRPEVTAFHLHPKDMGAAIVSFDEMRPSRQWLWAGPGWQDRRSKNVSRISSVDIQAEDPAEIAERWSNVFGRTLHSDGELIVMSLDEGEVRFRAAQDGRGDGVCSLTLEVTNSVAVRQAVSNLGLELQDNQIDLCGTRFKLNGLI
jgi:hypothetical protein